MPSPEQTLIAVNPVRADRADDFEGWLRSVVRPAMQVHQPHLEDRWRVLRSVEAAHGVVVFVFVFDGGTDDDWDLRRLLEMSLGGEAAERALADLSGMLAEEQHGWWLSRVPLDDVA